MKKALLFLFALLALIVLFGRVSAFCESGQIDINSASLEELDGLAGIGPVKAQAIIDTRPFGSVDNLLDVNGIGNITLDKIKTQGLACVSGEEKTSQKENISNNDNNDEIVKVQEEIIQKEENKTLNNKNESTIIESPTQDIPITAKTIVLNAAPKDIKSETDKEQLNKNKLAIYGLITFCILLAFLFIFKKKDNKNEFE